MDIVKANEVLTDVVKTMERIDGTEAMAVLCMVIDYIAKKNDMKSIDLLDTITPLIKEVNEDLGQWDYKEVV